MMITPGPNDKVYPVVKCAAILDVLREEGVPAEQALAGVGISERELSSPAARVSISQVIECYRSALELSRDPYFAFHAGLRFHLSTYGMYGFAMLASTDFRQTMRFAMAYHQLATPLADVCFSEENGEGIWTVTPIAHPLIDAGLYRYIAELQCGIHLSLQRDVMGPEFAFREVHFTFGPPAAEQGYPVVFGCPVVFGRAANRFLFDSAWLDRPAELGNQITYATVVKLCDALLEELELRAGVAGRVRQAILERTPEPACFENIAKDLNISQRTLRRRLREENTSFRKLADELQAAMAIKYLRETSLTIDEVACALGFTEVGNFRRAFRRWTRESPNRFRNIRTPIKSLQADSPGVR